MERFERHGSLEWWANSSTMLGSAEVSVSVAATAGSNWNAQANLMSDNDDDREGFVFLCDLDPIFLLRFDGEGIVLVTVHDIQMVAAASP